MTDLSYPSTLYGTAAGPSPATALLVNVDDNSTNSGFYNPVVLYHTVGYAGAIPSGSYRESLRVQLDIYNTPAGDFMAGFNSVATVKPNSSGSAFGLNGVAQALAGASAAAEIVGGELNVDARQNVARKVGLQVVDPSTSVGVGTAFDAAIYIDRQPGGAGFKEGLRIDNVQSSSINIAPTGGAANISFRTGNGGSFRSDTFQNGPNVILTDGSFNIQRQDSSFLFSVSNAQTYTRIDGQLLRLTLGANNAVYAAP